MCVPHTARFRDNHSSIEIGESNPAFGLVFRTDVPSCKAGTRAEKLLSNALAPGIEAVARMLLGLGWIWPLLRSGSGKSSYRFSEVRLVSRGCDLMDR
jgi:hypothetical protein